MFVRRLLAGAAVMLVSVSCMAETYVFFVNYTPREFESQLSGYESELNERLAEYGSGSFVRKGNTAKATVTSEGETHEVIVINNGGGSPIAASAITQNRVARNVVLDSTVPGEEGKKAPGVRHGGVRSDLFYNMWKNGDIEGSTYGLNASLVFGPSWFDLAITVPVHATAAEDGDPALSTGADCALRIPIGGLISIGGHGSYLLDIDSSDEADKTRSTVVVGPFASVAIPVGDSIMVSAGCMYEITQFENADDSIRQIVPAVNLGVRLTDNLAVNLYGIHFMNMDDELSDFDYTDVGGEVAVAMGIWKLSLGGKTSMGIEALDSIEAYFGSSWLF